MAGEVFDEDDPASSCTVIIDEDIVAGGAVIGSFEGTLTNLDGVTTEVSGVFNLTVDG